MFNISVDNFVCVLLYVIDHKWVYRLLSLNPEYNHSNNHNHVVTQIEKDQNTLIEQSVYLVLLKNDIY